MGISGVAAVVARSNDKHLARAYELGNSLGQVVPAVVGAVGCAHAHADNERFAHTVGVATDIPDAVCHFDSRQARTHLAHGTQDDIGSRGHASITVDMGSSSNARGVGAVCALSIVSGQCKNLVVNEHRPGQNRTPVSDLVARFVTRVIDPGNATQRWIVRIPESPVLIIKTRINDTDNDSRAIIIEWQIVGSAVQHIDDMGGIHGAVRAQFNPGADLNITHTNDL